MIDSHDPELPRELQALDAELSGISIDERPSFGPELRAELEAAYLQGEGRSRRPYVRRLAMAATVAIAFVGLSVPSARAALVELYAAVQDRLSPPADPPPRIVTPATSTAAVQTEPVFVPLPPPSEEEGQGEASVWSSDLTDLVPNDAYPILLDTDGVEEMVRWFYPDRLEHAGVGGVVRLILWVEADGSVSEGQIVSTSGVPELDGAALQAAQHFRFQPARRRGAPVGTWVEFDVNFKASARELR
jgi:TonB family protein